MLMNEVPRLSANPLEARDAGDGPLDLAALESLRSLGPDGAELCAELVEIFLQDAPVRLNAISEAIDRGDAGTLGQAAHSLKGMSATMGAARVARGAAALEAIAKSGITPPNRDRASALGQDFQSAADGLRRYIARIARGTPVPAI